MKAMTNTIRVGMLTAAMFAGPMWSQEPAKSAEEVAQSEQTVPTVGGPQSGRPGVDQQNESELVGNTPATNSTLQADSDGSMGINPGWLGLLGLAGLFGLRGGATRHVSAETHDMHRSPNPGMSRG